MLCMMKPSYLLLFPCFSVGLELSSSVKGLFPPLERLSASVTDCRRSRLSPTESACVAWMWGWHRRRPANTWSISCETCGPVIIAPVCLSGPFLHFLSSGRMSSPALTPPLGCTSVHSLTMIAFKRDNNQNVISQA